MFRKLILKPLDQRGNIKYKKFLIRGQEAGKITPFPVWMIPIPVLKVDFEPLKSYENDVEKEVF